MIMYALGPVSQRRLDRFKDVPPPSLHSALYYPDFEDSLNTGVKTMASAAIELFNNSDK